MRVLISGEMNELPVLSANTSSAQPARTDGGRSLSRPVDTRARWNSICDSISRATAPGTCSLTHATSPSLAS
ncbi:hypothetical protein GGH91_001435, partial [Coemansia sp. RSA 2671]